MNGLSKNLKNCGHENRPGVTDIERAEKMKRCWEQLLEQASSGNQGFIYIDPRCDNPKLVAKIMREFLEGKTERERLLFQQRVGIA